MVNLYNQDSKDGPSHHAMWRSAMTRELYGEQHVWFGPRCDLGRDGTVTEPNKHHRAFSTVHYFCH